MKFLINGEEHLITYRNLLRNCKKCSLEIDRDINGARNILLKNLIWCSQLSVNHSIVNIVNYMHLLKDNYGIRKLTPRECFNLQGFSKKYKLPNISDSKLYKLAGNGVSIPVIKLIADKIIKIMNDKWIKYL